jgi:non-ribosomal peptide synthetase component F
MVMHHQSKLVPQMRHLSATALEYSNPESLPHLAPPHFIRIDRRLILKRRPFIHHGFLTQFIQQSLTVCQLLLQCTNIMAPAQIALPSTHSTTPSKSITATIESIEKVDDAPIQTVDALIRHRARTFPHTTIVAYPRSDVEFVDYSMQQLDVFAYRVARYYQTFIPTRTSSGVKPTTVALLGPSNFEYAVTMLALTKLGHTVLFLSTRISQVAIESLIETTGATYLLADGRFLQTAADVQKNMPSVYVEEIAKQSVFDFPIEVHADTRLDYQLDHRLEASNNVYIIHSSGMNYKLVYINDLADYDRLDWPP